MDYEKAYKDALEKIREGLQPLPDGAKISGVTRAFLEEVFPELKESEGERIRKEIIDFLWKEKIFLQEAHSSVENNPKYRFVMDAIAWLEKQAPVEHFELKKGHWYMCHRAYCCRADHLTVKEGEKFQCEKDGIVKGFVIKEPEKYFIEVYTSAPMEDNQNDEVRRRSTIQVLEYARSLDAYNQYGKADIDKNIAWLEKQGEQDFSHNVDDEIRNELYDFIYITTFQPKDLKKKERFLDWIEKQGNNSNQTWKPSKEQINALEHFVRSIGESGYASPYDDNTNRIKSLLNDLCKLKKQGEKKVSSVDFKAKDWYVSEVDGKIHDMTYNPADKVEPKFKVRDWIINDQGSAFQIAYIDEENCRYVFEIGGYTKEEMNYENIAFANNHYREWTIDDAKDGDVLSNGKMIVIFKHFEEPSYRQRIVAYIGLDNNGDIQITDDTWTLGIDKAKPATKEQRTLLFQKMKEAGYEWLEETHELKEIEQKPTWSEDDEEILKNLIDYFSLDDGLRLPTEETIDWLKSLKERLI